MVGPLLWANCGYMPHGRLTFYLGTAAFGVFCDLVRLCFDTEVEM
jgi:hypothetical protein